VSAARRFLSDSGASTARWVSRVAEPGLLARPRPDGHDDLFRAQWGGRGATLQAVLAAPGRALSVADWEAAGHRPRAAWVGDVDHLRTAAVYVLGPVPRAYVPLWAGLPTAGLTADPDAGAAVRVCSAAEARRLRADWGDLKAAAGEALRAGVTAPPAVTRLLRRVLVARETLAGRTRVDGLL